MLDYAQIKAGKFRKNLSSFDVRNCVARVINIQKHHAQEKQLYLKAQFEGFIEESDYVIKTDEQRLA